MQFFKNANRILVATLCLTGAYSYSFDEALSREQIENFRQVQAEKMAHLLLRSKITCSTCNQPCNFVRPCKCSPGAAGTPGAVGTPGAIGTPGTVGTPGSIGTPGAVGTAGTAGSIGTPGAVGTPGSIGTPGAVGTAGVAGAIGTPGAVGTLGPIGTPGAVGTAGAAGAIGTPGAVGTPGSIGTPGAVGTAGAAGAIGTPGAVGTPGSIGTPGAVGTPGAPGAIGTPGAVGTPGAIGTPGAVGTPGAGVALIPFASGVLSSADLGAISGFKPALIGFGSLSPLGTVNLDIIYGSYAFTIPADGVLQNLNVSFDALVFAEGQPNIYTFQYRLFKSACNNGPTNAYTDTGYFADAAVSYFGAASELSGCGSNTGTLAVNAGDRVVLQVKGTFITPGLMALALSGSIQFVPNSI